MKGIASILSSAHRDVEAVAELLQRVDRHLLRLVRDHLALARFAHP
jgi:hypothetical protein